MPGLNRFTPDTQSTVTITSAVTTASVALPATARAQPKQLRVKNIDATNVAYINLGDSTVTATVPSGATGGSMPVGPGESIILSPGIGVTHCASICTAGTPIVFFTPGLGT